jgi:hypothetical protein
MPLMPEFTYDKKHVCLIAASIELGFFGIDGKPAIDLASHLNRLSQPADSSHN